LILRYTINSDEVAEALAARGDRLIEVIAEAMGLAGESLYEAIMYNMTGGIIQARTGLLSSSVVLSPVVSDGPVASVWCEIPDDGSFEHLVGMVLEFGGTHHYEIVPLMDRFAEFLGPSREFGKESMFSAEESIALAEGRLPRTLAWIGEGGGMVFAKRVDHPPSREFRYMRTSLDQVRETVRFQISDALAGVLAE
jgi:hypothetical protein